MIMKKNNIYLAMALLALAACNKEIATTEAGDITIDASIGAMTKVSYDGASTSFTAGDQITVYAWMGSAAAVPDTRVVDGVRNTLGTDGKWTPATQMRWKTVTDAHYFLGVYPAKDITNFTADAYTLDPAAYTASDLLIATNLSGVKASGGPVSLNFDHAMAKLNVNLKFRSQWDATPAVSSVTVTAKKTATVSYLTKAVTATGGTSEVDIPAAASAATGYTLGYSGLQVPQTGVKVVTVTIAGKEYVYESATDIPLESGKYTTLGLIVGKDKLELGSISVADWEAGTTLPDGNAVPFDALHTPLTLEATEDGTTVTITDGSSVTISYTINGGAPVSISADTSIPLQAGDKVRFFSTNAALGINTDPHDPGAISSLMIVADKKSYVYGNVMSIVDDTGDFATDVTLADYAMPRLFGGSYSTSNHIVFHADKPLMLPATNIAKYCYAGMFRYCKEMSTLPTGFLPAKEMKERCYSFMFNECSGLTILPDDLLPAGKGGEGSLAKSCYYSMFQSCSGLTTLADDFLPATTLADYCYLGMFQGCSGLTHAPILRAKTLVQDCYVQMFSSCRKLSAVTCLATNISASTCLLLWLTNAGANVSGPKTLYVVSSMKGVGTGIGDGEWNLADGWTLAEYHP